MHRIVGYLATLPLSFLAFPDSVALGVKVIVFVVAYFTSAPLLRAIDISDVERLEVAIGTLGVIARLLKPILRYELMILKLLR